MPNLRISDEVWVAVAQMQKEEGVKKPAFEQKDIIDRLSKNNHYGFVRPGVSAHISGHCVANNLAPDTTIYRMLTAVDAEGEANPGERYRRLYDKDDLTKHDSGQDPLSDLPDLNKIPPELQDTVDELIDWWCAYQNLAKPDRTEDRLTKAEQKNQIRLSGDIYPFLITNGKRELIDQVRNLDIVEHTQDGQPTKRYRNRAVTIKVGYALTKFEELGLTEAFEDYLSPRRTIKPSYRRWFEEHQELSSPANKLSDNLQVPRIADLHGPVRIKLSDHVYAFLAEYEQSLVIDEVNNFKLKDDADQSYHIRSLTVQIGFAISRIQNLGLYDEFEHFLPSEVDPRYLDLYTDYINTST